MKSLLLVISCLLLVLLTPMDKLESDSCAVRLAESCQAEACTPIAAADQASSDMNCEDDSSCHAPTDKLYDDDVLTLLITYDAENDDVVPFRMNSWGHQLRVLTSRIQLRSQHYILLVKKLTRLLSVHLTTLVNHISQFYSSIHSLCWQYAADCYVFAFRQIII